MMPIAAPQTGAPGLQKAKNWPKEKLILFPVIMAAFLLILLTWINPGWLTNLAIGLAAVCSLSTAASLYLMRRAKREAILLMAALSEEAASLRIQIDEVSGPVEQQVAVRTNDLYQETHRLQAILNISKTIASIQPLETLLPKIVQQISDRLGYGYTGIYLPGPTGDRLILRSAYLAGGQKPRERQPQRTGSSTLIGMAADEKKLQIVRRTAVDSEDIQRSEITSPVAEAAIPLISSGLLLGVLDIHSDRGDAFLTEEINALQTLADHVCIAIENALLFEEGQAALEATRKEISEVSQVAWKELLNAQPSLGVLCDQSGRIHKIAGHWNPDMVLAGELGQTVQTHFDEAAIPVKFNQQVGGMIRLRKPEGQSWTQEELSFVETLSEQLSIALESARLHNQVEQRAAHERFIGEVAARMRQSLDIDTVLKTAAFEIYHTLNLHDVTIRLNPTREHAGGITRQKSEGKQDTAGHFSEQTVTN